MAFFMVKAEQPREKSKNKYSHFHKRNKMIQKYATCVCTFNEKSSNRFHEFGFLLSKNYRKEENAEPCPGTPITLKTYIKFCTKTSALNVISSLFIFSMIFKSNLIHSRVSA